MTPTPPPDGLFEFDMEWPEREESKPISKTVEGWMVTGYCGVCLQKIEAMQPFGKEVRHVETKLPLCKSK